MKHNSPIRGARITGYGTALPNKVVTNDDLAKTMATSHDWIVERTGIHERRVGGTTAGLSVEAGAKALAMAGVDPSEIDLVILATTSPDDQVPGTSPMVQHELGLTCGAMDLNAACSGFVYGLVTAHGHHRRRRREDPCYRVLKRCLASPTGPTATPRSSLLTEPEPPCSKPPMVQDSYLGGISTAKATCVTSCMPRSATPL